MPSDRRPSCPVQMLYASTPIDASLFGLYIHQNYTQYCSTLEQCSSLIDDLSWTDANGSENVGHQPFSNTLMNADDGSSGTTRTRMRFIYRHLEHFIPYLVLFRAQDNVSSSLRSSVHCSENGALGMPWKPPHLGFHVYVACVVLLLDSRILMSYRPDFGRERRSSQS
jgi:hypothetical protein